ncbi:MAG TPA: zinc ribbon domain-containing protein [bacterium]|nr:zinc ribbon domain-containing protein [bacterium]
MPIYEYQCRICGFTYEKWQAFNDPPDTSCPQCPGRVFKVMHAPGVVFKGSGFYKNDSRKKTGSAASQSSGTTDKK